jgi:hypothetical protein
VSRGRAEKCAGAWRAPTAPFASSARRRRVGWAAVRIGDQARLAGVGDSVCEPDPESRIDESRAATLAASQLHAYGVLRGPPRRRKVGVIDPVRPGTESAPRRPPELVEVLVAQNVDGARTHTQHAPAGVDAHEGLCGVCDRAEPAQGGEGDRQPPPETSAEPSEMGLSHRCRTRRSHAQPDSGRRPRRRRAVSTGRRSDRDAGACRS